MDREGKCLSWALAEDSVKKSKWELVIFNFSSEPQIVEQAIK